VLLKKDIQFIKENLAPRSAPVLSIYLNVNPAEPTNANRAWLLRVKDSLKGLDVPRVQIRGHPSRHPGGAARDLWRHARIPIAIATDP